MMKENLSKCLELPIARRFGMWFSGISIYYWASWFYDYFFISFILWKYGNIDGGIIVMFASMLLDLGTLKFYDWFKKDWLALETLKGIENKKGGIGHVFRWVHNKGAVLTLVILSLLTNPFVVTTYMRKGAYQYNGMDRRDAVIFVSSSLLSNLYWVVIVGSGVSIAKHFYALFAL